MSELDLEKLRRNFGTDPVKEEQGARCEYADGIAVWTRRSNHPIARAALRKAFKRFQHLGKSLGPEHEKIIYDEAVANGYITRWEGLGADYTPERALAAFKATPDFRQWIQDQADDVDNFKLTIEADLGNSSATSTGSEPTGDQAS